jgi:hypothetical protein
VARPPSTHRRPRRRAVSGTSTSIGRPIRQTEGGSGSSLKTSIDDEAERAQGSGGGFDRGGGDDFSGGATKVGDGSPEGTTQQ